MTRVALVAAVTLALAALTTQAGLGQTRGGSASTVPVSHPSSRLEPATEKIRAYPRVKLGVDGDLEYLGTFCANAKFKKSTKFGRALEMLAEPSVSTSMDGHSTATQTEVPPRMIISARKVVEDYDPPAHARVFAQPASNLATIRNLIVTFAYGRAEVMESPRYVTTDSAQRVIISDPTLKSVHVFDPEGRTSFTIVGDRGHRLQQPAGVAVDAEDNIYIADSGRGMVLVYDRYGQFVRYIGNFHGENMYARPTAIAIDPEARRLYLADSPRHLLFILDLQGTELKRLGTDRNGRGSGDFVSPTQIAVSKHGIVVMDADGSRVQILDSEGNRIGSYRVMPGLGSGNLENGLAVDRDGNFLISYPARASIGVYHPDGTLLATFGQSGNREGEFVAPTGVWVDASNRIYVADTGNKRVQVFQIGKAVASKAIPQQNVYRGRTNR